MKKVLTKQDFVFTWALHPYQLYQYGIDVGLSSGSILQGTNLDESSIEDLNLHINWEQYRQMSTNFENSGLSDWCFQFGKRLSIASHGLFSLLALNCTNWRQVIEDIKTYSVLINPLFYVNLHETEDFIYINIHPEFTRDKILTKHYEGYFTTLYQAIFQLGAKDVEAIAQGITIFLRDNKPDYASSLERFFNDAIHWDSYCNKIRVSKDLIDRTIPNANPVFAAQTRRQLQAQLSQLDAQYGILRELRLLFEAEIYSLEECAKALYTSLPTLKRILKQAGTSFSRELTIYRVERACWSAIHADIEASELSEKLGFQDANSFSRLFKKETGFTYTEYQKIKTRT